jgi:3-methyl-2-oxobutanoate hydroxymethyltransferase
MRYPELMKQSVSRILGKKAKGEPITWLTCYDYSSACALNLTKLDMILVGDSGGMTVLGYEDTVPVTMEEMLFLCKAVRKGAPNKFIVGDMPKGSYEISDALAVENAMRFVKESGCDAIKLEGSGVMLDRIHAIASAGIPVIGHIGLTPQTSSQFGGYRVVGRSSSEAAKLRDDALKIQAAGAFLILLEATPADIGESLAKSLDIVCMGIGAGGKTDGQLLILHDLLGWFPTFRPKFAKCYVPDVLPEFLASIQEVPDLVQFGRETRLDGFARLIYLSVDAFISEVEKGNFPTNTFSY